MILAEFAIGTVGQWVTVLAIVGTAWAFYRGGGGAAVSTLQDANRVLERRVRELEKTNREQEVELTELRARTDHVAALEPLLIELRDHDVRRASQSSQILTVLELIAAKLGPDNDERE